MWLRKDVAACVASIIMAMKGGIQQVENALFSERQMLTGRHSGVFQSLSHVVHGRRDVKDANKKRRAQAMMTL